MTWTQEKVTNAYKKVENLAVTDAIFRSELLANPNKAIEKVLGEKLPDNYNIKVIEGDASYSATFVLPAMLSNEVKDSVLSAVAGGVSYDMEGDNCTK